MRAKRAAARRKPRKKPVGAKRELARAKRRVARARPKPAKPTARSGRKRARAKARPTATKQRPARTKSRSVRPQQRPARSKRRPARPRLAVVRPRAKRRPAVPPPPAFPQTAGASGRQRTLFELVRARAALMAALQGLGPAAAGRPMAEGKWSVRATVLHLVTRDQARLREMEAALRGNRVSWATTAEEDWPRVNAETLAPLAGLAWEEALRLLQTTRQKLMESLEAVPEEPAEVWSAAHPFGEMLAGLPPHDRHHAEQIKRWREEAAAPKT